MLDSLNDTTIPDEFKEFVKAQDLENDKIATMINANPRILFDVFDNHKVYIQITYYDGPNFWCSINGVQSENKHSSRIAAETEAIQGAFTILEAKL